MARGGWTRDRLDELRRLMALGWSSGKIGEAMGVSRNAVIGKGSRLGLRFGDVSGQDRQRIVAKGGRQKPKFFGRESKFESRPAPPPKGKSLPPQLTDGEVARLAAIPDTVGVASLLDLEDHHCRYPVGEPTRGFCGQTQVGGLPYCPKHANRCYRPTEPVSRGVAISAVSARLKVVA